MTTHDQLRDRLSEYLDGELDPGDRREVSHHLGTCAECRQLLDELRAVVTRAGQLTDTPPALDLWPGVADRIGSRKPRTLWFPRAPRTISFTLPQLVAAGLALMVLSGGTVWLARLGGNRTDFPPVGASAPATPAGEAAPPELTTVNFADEHYDRAIADLQATLERERSRLDPGTVRVLETNLQAIDRAIQQCRQALEEDPANVYLNVHLADARKRKLALLREAAALAGS